MRAKILSASNFATSFIWLLFYVIFLNHKWSLENSTRVQYNVPGIIIYLGQFMLRFVHFSMVIMANILHLQWIECQLYHHLFSLSIWLIVSQHDAFANWYFDLIFSIYQTGRAYLNIQISISNPIWWDLLFQRFSSACKKKPLCQASK